ncbi:protocadherin-like wing polarity protein stan [Phlebotomus papatasi]|uniref:protocadherin-like wing polarity protein stan n=1 Tax=Phlebotomus papatasi TaxID=29031 RepID=UPI002483F032|nr:protocadherin-like wing polarity protein stan [Phlebotomus papatasi]
MPTSRCDCGSFLFGIVFLATAIHFTVAYLVIVDELEPPGTVIFNASVYKLGSERHYKINTHRSANFVHHLVEVDSKNGQIRLKKSLSCDGIYYPNLFTFYVDSTSNMLRSIDYYSLPLRVFISGKECNDERRLELFGRAFEEDDHFRERRSFEEDDFRAYGEYRGNNFHFYKNDFPWMFRMSEVENATNYRNFREGDVLFDSQVSNNLRHEIINRKRRHLEESLDQRMHRKIADAKQWVSETYASYAIHNTDKWNKICLKKSQFINSLNAFLPKSVQQSCKVTFLDVGDERFKIEQQNGDLVASRDHCIFEPMWKVIVTLSVRCNRMDLVDADHRLKIVYHHQEFNDTDIARRVRRELRNQSPYFEQALYLASVLEEQPPNAIVTTVRARDPEDSPVVYSMVSLLDSRSQSMFKVDSRTGVVTTATSLDRELMDVHYFRVVATDDSFPPRSGTTTLQVNVLDCNDHSPTFEAEQFDASIREGATVGSTVITLRATDQDFGKNAEIEYAIESVTGGGVTTHEQDAQTFRIDGRSGVISTRSGLDRETAEVYTLIVSATDMASPQSERKSATATVVVKVLDDNDNYPQFSERTYTIQVSEDQWGDNNVVAHIKATDADQGNNAAIRYAIIGGNTQSQFSIDSLSGDVTLVKPLDYENVRSYRLVIRAQDGGSPSRSNTTQLLVNVLDANDNAPRFYTSQFQEAVLESVPVGYNIVRVQAYDSDEGQNAEITYNILEREDNFPLAVDPRTGWVHTLRPLDREEQSRYSFQVVAVDGGIPPKSASTSVVVTIQDVNDNDPVFSPKYYEATIGEDQPLGTPVTTVTATDPDEDSRLHYELSSGNTRGRFAITSQNGRGLITIAQPLDYKQERRFVLTVTATDSGGRTDTATVNVNITDANNFAPVFENAPYTSSVFEDAPVGTTVLVVSATDSDVGINAQITYSLNDETVNGLGASEPFTVNPQTGAIVTNAPLDRETISGYLLTVTAKDGGNPSHSDTTDVEITVTDVNDNPPVFKVPVYQASIPEDALIGTSVIQIAATDLDQGINGRIKYALSDKDKEDGSFVVDPTSGIIRTNKGLDRESVPVYHLTAIAVDRGTPSLSSSVEVQVRLEDINDSPPTFESDKITLYVAENSPVGSVVGEIHAHDPDEGVNALVQYSIIGGDDSNFFNLVVRPGSERAQLVTLTELDYESPKKKFELVIRAASPPLRNDVHVEILVTDVNDNAPVLKDFQVIFNNFRDCFPSGEFGRIPAFDADVTDKLNYKILSGNNANLVRLNSSTGGMALSPQLNTNVPKFATMEVSVTDGINEAKAIMQLVVRLITEDMLFNSVTVRLDEMTEEAFLSPLLNFFLDGLAAIIPCPKENIFIFSIQDDTDVSSRILNVSFSARRPDLSHEEFYSPQYLQERVYLNRAILARLATVHVLPFDDNICVREPCLNYEECLTVLKFGNASGFIHSDTVLFRPIYPVNTFACRCPEGFTGSREHYLCDTEVDLCYSDPCRNGGTCVRREGGYTCVCGEDFTGSDCGIPVKSLPPCTAEVCEGGFSCIYGNISPHHPPYTSTCELKSRSFSKNSFLTFNSLKQRHRFTLKMKFATVHENGLLLYNGRYNELHDFIALEILSGKVVFSFSLGDAVESVTVNKETKVSDGLWHTVEVTYFNRTVVLALDDCDTALALSGDLGDRWSCANQTTLKLDKRCTSLTESCHRFLDLTGPLQLGGLPKIPAHFQIQSHDYIGCISDFYIDRKFVDLNSYVADNGTVAGCPQKAPSCASEPCFNGATCHEGWGVHLCECPEGFTGNACQESVPPPWRFAGDGVLSFNPLLRPIQLPWLTALSIRTRQKDAFLMQIQVGQNSSAIVSLKDGILHYIYNGEPMFLSGVTLSDGEWHRIEIKWLGMEISLSIDYGQRTGVVPMSQKIQGLYVGKIIIGGPDGVTPSLANFGYYEGCIQDVRIGGPQSVLNRPTMRENVIDGCSSAAQCPDFCPDHSVCVTSWDEAHCECLPSFVGSECAPICTVKPCSSGICRVDGEDRKGYHCECNSTFSHGEYCELQIQQPCPGGWWGERGCGPCRCNLKQGYHPDCNKTTGQCYCKENHYQPVNETACLPCDCYSIGSYSGSCNRLTGQCECREGVIGRRCDSCSNPYAEVTLNGCEVVYDACPRSFSAGLWWPRTPIGLTATESCPLPARGKGFRVCDSNGWSHPDMFNCTSEPFIELRKQLSQMEKEELSLNSFIAVKMASNLQQACEIVGMSGGGKMPQNLSVNSYAVETSFLPKEDIWSDNFEMDYLTQEFRFIHDRLYGADLLVTEGILHELINYEMMQSGLNLSHSQDKDFIRNLVQCASVILDEKYSTEWKKLTSLTMRGPNDLVDAFNKYMVVLARSQHDTYTNPFEIVHQNMVLGLDIVTAESLFGYEPQQLSEYHKNKVKSHQFTTESVILPDTSSFLQHSSRQKIPILSFPKYNNYIQDKAKFDLHSKILIPLDMLGIAPPGKDEVTHSVSEYRAIVSYAQYKDAGGLFPDNFDDTVTRRWGVDVQIASPILSLAILVPSTKDGKEPVKKPDKTDLSDIVKIPSNDIELMENHHEEIPKLNEEIKIMAHDMDEGIPNLENTPEIHLQMPSEAPFELEKQEKRIPEPIHGENEAMYEDRRRLFKREVLQDSNESSSDIDRANSLIYRSLGSPHLLQPIKIQMWLNIDKSGFGIRSNPQCVRWNSFTNSWTRIGCQTEIPDYELVAEESVLLINCSCTHVSNYAVLVDVIDPEDVPEPSLLVQISSYSAFMISLPILLAVLIALALLRGMQTNSNTIHQNLVLCVFVAELLYFVTMQARKDLLNNEFPCKLIAISLHYAWLAAFAWTTVDCIHLYRMLTEMRDINHGPMGFYFSLGYGAPAILVGLSVGVRAHEYGNSLFCWLSIYEAVVWWLVGPIAGMSVLNLLILFVSVKAAFTLKDHVLGFGNLRTLLWLSVVSLPLMGVMWVLAVLSASENSQLLNVLLCVVVFIHAIFCLIGYCIINKRVRENLHRSFLRCMGRKVPLLDSSLVVSSSSQNVNPRSPGGFLAGSYETTRRNIGISASSTTSRSTAKTSSSPYRSDGQLRHTSTSTSNYNSASDVPSYLRGYEGRQKEGKPNAEKYRRRKDSDSGSDTDGRSLDLASSHSSDEEESRVGGNTTNSHRSAGVSVTPYLPNITEHVTASTPPELNVVQSPQLFPSLKPTMYAPRWSSQVPESYLPTPANPGRWSQDTGSDNEVHPHKANSPNPLPNPDLTDTSYLHPHSKMNMPPSILENIAENYNLQSTDAQMYDNERYKYEMDRESLYGRKKDYQDNYGDYDTGAYMQNKVPYASGSEKDYGSTQIVNHIRPYHNHHENPPFLHDRTHGYLGSQTGSPYMSKEHIAAELYSPRESHYALKSPPIYGEPMHSVHTMLKNDYQHRAVDYHSDRMSETSDKNSYKFPFNAEEDHSTCSMPVNRLHGVNDINNPGILPSSRLSSRHGSRASSPPTGGVSVAPMQPLAPLTSITDTSEKATDDAETTV